MYLLWLSLRTCVPGSTQVYISALAYWGSAPVVACWNWIRQEIWSVPHLYTLPKPVHQARKNNNIRLWTLNKMEQYCLALYHWPSAHINGQYELSIPTCNTDFLKAGHVKLTWLWIKGLKILWMKKCSADFHPLFTSSLCQYVRYKVSRWRLTAGQVLPPMWHRDLSHDRCTSHSHLWGKMCPLASENNFWWDEIIKNVCM